jgi:hypothetical protein
MEYRSFLFLFTIFWTKRQWPEVALGGHRAGQGVENEQDNGCEFLRDSEFDFKYLNLL